MILKYYLFLNHSKKKKGFRSNKTFKIACVFIQLLYVQEYLSNFFIAYLPYKKGQDSWNIQ